jgi:hypothetical protein
MSELEPIVFRPADDAAQPHSGTSSGRLPVVTFDRRELNHILGVYGRRVAQGEWRDYGIDMLKDRAVFSIFRRSSERALYTIEKRPRLARKQGAYCIIASTGLILKRGHDLQKVLQVLDKRLRLVEA